MEAKESGNLGYTDLEFVLKDGEVASIRSRFRGYLSDLTEDPEFIKTAADFAEFPHPISFYVDKAKKEILKSEGGQIRREKATSRSPRSGFTILTGLRSWRLASFRSLPLSAQDPLNGR